MKRGARASLVAVALAIVGCSGSDDTEDVPQLDRIDGPAEVDPSYDPTQLDPSNTVDPSSPAVTATGG